MNRFVKGNEASKLLKVHQRTLYQWDKKGWIQTIRTKGGIRLYNVEKYINDIKKGTKIECYCEEDNNLDKLDNGSNRMNISYVRVSSNGQKDDLQRQYNSIKEKYPNNIIIKDIGSGINMNRRGLNKIIELAIAGKIKTLVVEYKDRLTRFGYEMIENIIKKYSNGEIIIINKKEKQQPEAELIMDVMYIMNVFIAKMNGLRKYKKLKNN